MFFVYVGVSKTIMEHLVISGCHHYPNCRNELSLYMKVLCQVINVILLLDNFYIEVDYYMYVQMLGDMYNTGWPIYQINHAFRHHFWHLYCQSLLLNIFESYSHFSFSGEKERRWIFRQKENLLEQLDTEVCMVKPLQIQKWASFIWSLANGVNVSSCYLHLQKLDRLLHWECSTIHHEFGDCFFLCP